MELSPLLKVKGSAKFDERITLEGLGIVPRVGRAPQIRTVVWSKPRHGWLKLFVDGSSRGNPGSGSGGGIIRNHNGEFIEAFCHFYGVVTSVEAEFRALRDGLDLCEDLCTHLEIECDSQVVVEAVSKRRNVPWKVRDLWLDILDSLRRITWTISHVFREGNCVADCLASISGDLNSDQVFFFASELPRPVRLALQSDYIGIPI